MKEKKVDPNAIYKISYGLYVVCSTSHGKINGQIVNTIFQVTSDPKTIAVSINNKNLTCQLIKKSKVFTVSILKQDTPMKFIGTFGFKSGKNINKFEEVNHKVGETSCPIVIDHTIACFEVNVINEVNIGTHTIFIGKILSAEVLSDDEPMTYDYYHKVKGGKSPKNAPTYNGNEKIRKGGLR